MPDSSNTNEERALPPIHRIKEPPMLYMSTRIRWYTDLGYTVAEIYKYLGVRYQQVRNVLGTAPKRAAREDIPPLVIELYDLETDIEAMEAQALVENMAALRAEDRASRKANNALRRRLARGGAEGDGDEEGADDDEEQAA